MLAHAWRHATLRRIPPALRPENVKFGIEILRLFFQLKREYFVALAGGALASVFVVGAGYFGQSWANQILPIVLGYFTHTILEFK